MTARALTAAATAFLAAAALASCSDDGRAATTTTTPASGITSAPSSAATADVADPDAFPTAPADLPTRAQDGTVYPGETWQHARPRALGFSAHRMRVIARDARASKTTCLLVARKGRMVGEWNWQGVSPDTPREVYSVAKSVTSTLVGVAQAHGLLSIEQRAAQYVEEWRGTKSSGVTIRDLLSNQSGRFWDVGTDYGQLAQAQDRTQFAVDLDQQYPPGQVWAYNNAAVQTLDRVLSEATGRPTREYAASRVFGPIGMTHTQMTADQAGNTNTFFGVQTTCEDLARFGYLFLRQGRWGDAQVVPKAWVRAAVGRPSQDHNAAYGFLWWLNRYGPILGPLVTDAPGRPEPPVGRTMPEAAADVFTAQGLGGQTLLVDPGSETVVVRIGQFSPAGEDVYTARDAVRFVTEALVRPSAG